jgi:hypothetical protein
MATRLSLESTTEMFRDMVELAVERQGIEPSGASRNYLVQLLDDFVHSEKCYAEADQPHDVAVAEVFCHGVSSDGMRRFSLLKLSGDLSLFTAGFFSDSLERRPVDVDYYRKLGGTAYATVAGDCSSRRVAGLFRELAKDFVAFSDVLGRVSESCHLTDGTDLLRLYEKWRLVGSRHSAERLRGLGFAPAPGSETVH